jgi:two-component system, NarL family, sensor histidine kinase UhpB
MGFSRLPLLWRVFAINAALLVAGTVALVVFPGRVHASAAVVEIVDLAVGIVVMLVANFLLLRQTLAPVDRLAQRMRTVDLLRPGQRLVERGGREVGAVVRAFNQMLDRLEAERRESSRRALSAQESERARIARGLHDEVGQVLTGVLLQLDAVGRSDETDRGRRIDDTKEAVRSALEDVRRMSQELRPELLEHLGLASALTELARQFTDGSGVAVDRRLIRDLPPLSEESELAIYRVAQESLTNVARHAEAQRVELTLEPGAHSVVLRVADDGRGIEEATELDGRGGLRGMRERALLAGGVLAVRRAPQGGVEIRLEVPAEDA